MLWEGRPLREIREADLRRLVDSGLEEHLQLEYKSELYGDSDQGRREFLLDICMFANAEGGILLIGVPERRDQEGSSTGAPDPGGVLGVELQNPEAVLSAYDARVMEAIEERLPLESTPIDVGNGRRVIAIRVTNSANKPHSVRHKGHIYFPSRRERQRYHMTVREIKELVMRTGSRLQQAKEALESSFLQVTITNDLPYLLVGIIPVFFEDFLVDVRLGTVQQAVVNFSRTELPESGPTVYTFDGLERRENQHEYTVRFHRSGLLNASLQLPLIPQRPGAEALHLFHIAAIDLMLRRFVLRASAVYEGAGIAAPFILGMMLRTRHRLFGAYAGHAGTMAQTAGTPARDYSFPHVQVDDLSATDRLIRPLCDQAHQMFGLAGSRSFNSEGVWVAQYV
jgi:Putative DNA-binding domain